MKTKTVGIRELKNRLSEYVRLARKGERVLVTDRGEVVAELTAPREAVVDPAIPPGLVELARQGRATLPTRRPGPLPPLRPLRRPLPPGFARQLLDATREDR